MLIAALDVNGFVYESFEVVERVMGDLETSEQSFTVDAGKFLAWVKTYLCPVLGRYSYGEPRSIVVMDNASTHMTWEVKEAIRDTGAYLLYTAPYSPDLNLIACAFNVYKQSLKRNEIAFLQDPYEIHLLSLQAIKKDFCVERFKNSMLHTRICVMRQFCFGLRI